MTQRLRGVGWVEGAAQGRKKLKLIRWWTRKMRIALHVGVISYHVLFSGGGGFSYPFLLSILTYVTHLLLATCYLLLWSLLSPLC